MDSSRLPPPRMIPHRKSRNGCARCKQRRVKCDEQVPCTACTRHQVPCSLSTRTASTSPSCQSASRSLPSSHVSPILSSSMGAESSPDSARFSQSTPGHASLNAFQQSLAAFDTHDCFVSIAELMSHWTTKAHASMGIPESPHLLQVDVPQQAFAHPYLLRSMLAFSAFHLAYLDETPPSKYRLLALRHQHLSLRGLREALQQATAENCHALYLTALLLAVTKFATFPECTCFHHHDYICGAPIESLVEVFSVCAGVATIRGLFNDELASGPFQFLFSSKKQGEESNGMLPGLLDQLWALKNVAQIHNEESEPIIMGTIDKLIACSLEVSSRPQTSTPPEPACIYIWPMHMAPPFIDLVTRREPAALAVLAHYCLLIHWGGAGYWCFDGCYDSVMKEITSEMRGSCWESTLEWPLRMASET